MFSALFFGLILTGPLDFAIFRRYCLSHPVAIASVCLFMVGIVALLLKWLAAQAQTRLTAKAANALRRLVTDGEEIAGKERPAWLAANWQSQSQRIQESWFGGRILRALELQLSRGRRQQLEADLKSLGELDADRQHDSYSLLRIINWAMPMLGFLGTVLGISQTLGQLDTKMLATQQQEAMNQLTAGLYVAFDTTAIALILTVFLMFVQFAVSRLEQSILSEIDEESNDCLVQFLSADPFDAQDSLLTPVREVMQDLLVGVRQLAVEQSTVWSRSIQDTQQQWTEWTTTIAKKIDTQIGQQVGSALDKHVSDLSLLQDDGNRQQDLRWQQWQTTLSDQARLIQGQQKEMIKQSDALHELVDATSELRKLEETIHDSVSRLENIHRIEEATQCVGEAVAVLATCLERSGVIRGLPVRPRASQATANQLTPGTKTTTTKLQLATLLAARENESPESPQHGVPEPGLEQPQVAAGEATAGADSQLSGQSNSQQRKAA
ncbi:MAG: MotA/TolQ/ExbB proton channel family protein [Planctomycetales bacterium]|nr:MotA/TolQ/ExbB proton channel family protein [Planctomycetales bacterium]